MPDRVNVLGVGVNATSLDKAVAQLIEARERGESGYVCVTGAHGIMESQRDESLRQIHNRSIMTVPDGMPTVWMGREYGFVKMSRVYGPDLMLAVCEATAALNQQSAEREVHSERNGHQKHEEPQKGDSLAARERPESLGVCDIDHKKGVSGENVFGEAHENHERHELHESGDGDSFYNRSAGSLERTAEEVRGECPEVRDQRSGVSLENGCGDCRSPAPARGAIPENKKIKTGSYFSGLMNRLAVSFSSFRVFRVFRGKNSNSLYKPSSIRGGCFFSPAVVKDESSDLSPSRSALQAGSRPPTSGKKCLTHFLYGATEETLCKLKANLEERFPGIQIVGTYAPPFRPLTDDEERELQQTVAECKPDFFWVGLSTPKQERFMAMYDPRNLNLTKAVRSATLDHCSLMGDEECLTTNNQQLITDSAIKRIPLDCGILLGVGAAFDIHAGNVKDTPKWIQNAGLQWLHRLCKEPRRLWRRYLWIVPGFLWLAFLQVMGLRRFPPHEEEERFDH